MKIPLPQRPVKEVVIEIAQEVPPAKYPTTTLLVAKTKAGRDSVTPKTTSSEPSLQTRSIKKKKKQEPTLELESEEESTAEDTGSSGGNPESGEEAEPVTPPLAKKGVVTRSSDQKRAASATKIPVAPKRPMKTPGKGGSSQKKPKGK